MRTGGVGNALTGDAGAAACCPDAAERSDACWSVRRAPGIDDDPISAERVATGDGALNAIAAAFGTAGFAAEFVSEACEVAGWAPPSVVAPEGVGAVAGRVGSGLGATTSPTGVLSTTDVVVSTAPCAADVAVSTTLPATEVVVAAAFVAVDVAVSIAPPTADVVVSAAFVAVDVAVSIAPLVVEVAVLAAFVAVDVAVSIALLAAFVAVDVVVSAAALAVEVVVLAAFVAVDVAVFAVELTVLAASVAVDAVELAVPAVLDVVVLTVLVAVDAVSAAVWETVVAAALTVVVALPTVPDVGTRSAEALDAHASATQTTAPTRRALAACSS